MKVIKTILIVLGVVFGIPFVVGMIIGVKDSVSESTYQSNYTEVAYKPFMANCNPDGAQTEYCQCAYDYLDRNTTDDEFRKLDQSAIDNPNYYPPMLEDAMNYCLSFEEA